MANGDAAAAAGMATVPGTADKRLGYDEINKTRDYIAQRTSTVQPVAKGGTGADNAAQARVNLNIYAETITNGAGGTVQADLNYLNGAKRDIGDGQFGGVPIYTPSGRNSPVTSGYVAAYLNNDGRLGASASTRRLKQDIEAWSPDKQALLAIELYQFRYIAAVEEAGDEAEIEWGTMAEDLDALGLSWLVFYDDEGRPNGVHYERIGLAILPVVQDHEARLLALEHPVAPPEEEAE